MESLCIAVPKYTYFSVEQTTSHNMSMKKLIPIDVSESFLGAGSRGRLVTQRWPVAWWWPVAQLQEQLRFHAAAARRTSDLRPINLLIQIAQTINFLPAACSIFSWEEWKHGNVWLLLLLISIKSFEPQRFCGGGACADLLLRVIIRSHSWLTTAYLWAYFHADCCETQIVFLLTHYVPVCFEIIVTPPG